MFSVRLVLRVRVIPGMLMLMRPYLAQEESTGNVQDPLCILLLCFGSTGTSRLVAVLWG